LAVLRASLLPKLGALKTCLDALVWLLSTLVLTGEDNGGQSQDGKDASEVHVEEVCSRVERVCRWIENRVVAWIGAVDEIQRVWWKQEAGGGLGQIYILLLTR
jgi:hypothetical protein